MRFELDSKLPGRGRGAAIIVMWAMIVLGLGAGYGVYRERAPSLHRLSRLREYWTDPQGHQSWTVEAGTRCGQAPFLMPTDGYIGFFWGDPFRAGRAHQGLDIFGPTGPDGLGQTPVVAAHDGFLTRQREWRSAVIIRLPEDPLAPQRQIWTYYTHMADERGRSFIADSFPPGTHDRFVKAGTLLGYQGNFSGDPGNPTGMHLHFSIVRDDSEGNFLNELDIENTLDPTPYLGIAANAELVDERVSVCADAD